MAIEAALGLGGNLGDPVAAFAAALEALEHQPTIRLMRLSSVWRTAPWGKLDQPEFLNMAVLIETDLPADELLALCLSVERENGRERSERWGPRTLDIDILSYGDVEIDQPGLQVPHPRLAERAFALAPLAEIAPMLAIGGQTAAELRDRLADPTVRRDAEATERLRSALD
ncbi:2-amino-4-hydroxy-6-hydroxymethyldihydropteridine diphosphokinase [Bosea vaviloviae]|uniref:2-amino-4-hydroxy-6-hydroxymethyldihydropteridine pyrophosphokinase n=1 Tax=Bosea vaviloviae TaxID=1526658 RepID=A0A1D7U8K3_9HYPH|nr:2-amino-4-hydroxy-6-hydroxymethyldihydropteridine diphosphokinase [Bosea vaviloviae]AOO83718.1 2-amino-4-hydroxy-6-hydroxymethyldihydropteridine diphosphokinase [Bosea vaviloviae]